MRMSVEIIDSDGNVITSAGDDVSQDGDLTTLVQLALDRFRRAHPDQSFMTEVGQAGFTMKFGKAERVDA